MIFEIRHDGKIAGLKMILNQLARAIVTRKDPFKKKKTSNLFFHKTFIKRIFYLINSIFSAFKNYNKVKIGNYPTLKNEKITI